MKCRLSAVIGILTMLVGLLPGSVFAAEPMLAQVVVPVPGPALTVNVTVVNDGEGGQTDPHLSGDWVSYTDNSVFGIRFQNLDLGAASDRLISHPDSLYDSLSDISGNTIVFMHATSANQSIYLSQIDPFGNPGPAVEVSPSANDLRGLSKIGGDTIAYEDRSYDPYDPSNPYQSEISLSSVLNPAAPAYRLTNDTLSDEWPAVSPDGNAIVWKKCTSLSACKIWRAERITGAWGAPEQVTGPDGSEHLPDTNGPVTVYNSDAGGDIDIRWSVKDSSGAYVESVLALPGVQRNPNIAGDLISFESSATPGSQFDIWLYDLTSNRLYRLTDTSVSESLTDITASGGLVRVAWAQPKQVYPYDMDVYALSFVLPPLEADITAPTITMTAPVEEVVYLLGQTVNADYACQDEAGGSGLASCVGNVPNGSPIDTSSIGVKTFTVDAADNAGNVASATHTYRVLYNFTGFTSPVDNPPTMNIAKAGQTIPLKFRITDAFGNPVTDLSSVTVTAVSLSCSSSPTSDAIEEYAASNSGLQNLGDGYYQWNWKSPTSYANSCKTLKLDLGEGAGFEHLALFQFRK